MKVRPLIEAYLKGSSSDKLLEYAIGSHRPHVPRDPYTLHSTAHVYVPAGVSNEAYDEHLGEGIIQKVKDAIKKKPSPVPGKKEGEAIGKFGMSYFQAHAITGGLSNPSKMPGYATSTPAWKCQTGSILHKVEGSVCRDCYARGGMYTQPTPAVAMTARHNSLDHPHWVQAMATMINHHARTINYSGRKITPHVHFRWHDSGDIQSPQHMERIAEVARLTPDVKHWIPTKETKHLSNWLDASVRAGKKRDQVVPSNLIVRISHPKVDQRSAGIEKKFGKVRGIAFSDVSEHNVLDSLPSHLQDAEACRAPERGGHCGTCRSCWDENTGHVVYHQHIPKNITRVGKTTGTYLRKSWNQYIEKRAAGWSEKFKSSRDVPAINSKKIPVLSDEHNAVLHHIANVNVSAVKATQQRGFASKA